MYHKLPYKNKLLEPAVTEQQVSKDRALLKPGAFHKASEASALTPTSRLHLLPDLAVPHAGHVPKEGGSHHRRSHHQEDADCSAWERRRMLLRQRRELGRFRPSEGSKLWAFPFQPLGSIPALKTQHHEG